MNKTALKNFATWSRRKLIEQVQTKAYAYGIDEKNELHIEEQFGQLLINKQTYPLSMKSAFTALQKQLEQKGYKQLLEEIAYTWFNRIIAIRYMEVHEFLPEKVNVLSSAVGRVDPDILFEYDTMDLAIDEVKVRELINAGDTEAAFRILFVAQCNALNAILPFMFEKIQDYTELLLPDFLLDAESVIKTLVQNEELTESFEEIEVIGWLYQYYIAEEKDRVFAQKSKYKKEEIPFATQLFTPKWIVQYMVQNSLGRYWTEAHREDEDLIDNWEYFIKHEEEDFHEKIAPYVNKELKVEDIKLLDPAMGSGHILVYAFEVFHEIYEKCGYPERDIPRLILENNLYGLDIDDRAYQLASFAVVMKAASYSKRFLRSVEREGITLNLASIQETNHVSDEVIAYIAQEDVGERYNEVKAFFEQYHNAKTYGSLINITERDIEFIEERIEQIANNPVNDLFYGEQHEMAKQVLPALIYQTKIMRNEYDIVVMNPPYMGYGSMEKDLIQFLKISYPNGKNDLFAAFMESSQYLKNNGIYSAINQQSWMFLSTFKELRENVLINQTIDTMIHLGTRAFQEIVGEVVQSTVFVLRNYTINEFIGKYMRLTNINESYLKKAEALNQIKNRLYYNFKQVEFDKIPGTPIAYWIESQIIKTFENKLLKDYATTRKGMVTGDNNRFIRNWYEVNFNKIGLSIKSREDAKNSQKKWFPYMKGGESRKWYGNQLHVINWEKDGYELFHMKNNGYKVGSTNHNLDFIFKPAIIWNSITTSRFSARFCDIGFLYDQANNFLTSNSLDFDKYLLGILNSSFGSEILDILNPTLNFVPGNIDNIPVVKTSRDKEVIKIVNKLIEISKENWDLLETSYDFQSHFLISETDRLSISYSNFLRTNDKRNEEIMFYEKKINEIFIEIYGLENEVNNEINKENTNLKLSLRKADIISFLSYFVGCLTGRYSLDIGGLAYGGGDWDSTKYTRFKPIQYGVISITENRYFEKDIITYLRKFLEVIFTKQTVEENLQWLAEGLEMKKGEDPETRIRRYFMDEFFDEHCKMYHKKPIYWIVHSGKQKGLRTLIYMHRYQPDTMATIRFEHLQELQAKYQQEIADLENRLVNPNLSAADKKKLNVEKVSFEKKINELREFDKRLAEIAAEEIEIDLDDGVKVNYEKFYRGGKGVLAKIK